MPKYQKAPRPCKLNFSEKRHDLNRTETKSHNFYGAVYSYRKSIIYWLDTPVPFMRVGVGSFYFGTYSGVEFKK